MRIVAIAGLPASGKSTLARGLSRRLRWPVLDKDVVRRALFGERFTAYTRRQDDFCARMLHDTVRWIAASGQANGAILDGRTHSKRYQVREVEALARELGATLLWIECVCDASTARERLRSQARHPARNRDFEAWRGLRRAREPLDVDRLVLDTARLSRRQSLAAALEHVMRGGDRQSRSEPRARPRPRANRPRTGRTSRARGRAAR